MANIMSQKNVRNKVHRNGFDLSFRNTFTAKVGELLPVMVKEVIPGDKFNIDVSAFTRTQPVNTAAFTRLREYYDFYFVPNRLLWDKFPAFISQTRNPTHAYSPNMSAVVDYHPFMSLNAIYTLLQGMALASYDNPLNGSLGFNFRKENCFNSLGYNRYENACKLLSYLGYGPIKENLELLFNLPYEGKPNGFTWSDVIQTRLYNPLDSANGTDISVNPFPLMAYHKIYEDYFRFQQWEPSSPFLYNVDYMMGNPSSPSVNQFLWDLRTFYSVYLRADYSSVASGVSNPYVLNQNSPIPFDIHYCNYKKDLLMGILPSPQFGDTAIASPIIGEITPYIDGTDSTTGAYRKINFDNIAIGDKHNAGLSVFALRQAEFLQKWREITQSGNLDYREQLEKHWNVKTSRFQSDMCEYLGGTAGTININEVVNNALGGDSDTVIKGKGVGSVGGHISREFNEHGILMCIYHCEPILDYANIGIDRLNTKVTADAYAIPEFDSLGMEALPIIDITAQNIIDENAGDQQQKPVVNLIGNFKDLKPLGYVPRYIEYKTARDVINGDFNRTLKQWVAPIDAKSLFNRLVDDVDENDTRVTFDSFKVSPAVVNPIFITQVDENCTLDQDVLLIGAFFDCKVVRNLSTDGLPY